MSTYISQGREKHWNGVKVGKLLEERLALGQSSVNAGSCDISRCLLSRRAVRQISEEQSDESSQSKK